MAIGKKRSSISSAIITLALLSFVCGTAAAQIVEGFETGLPTSAPSTATDYVLSSGTWTILKGSQSGTKHNGSYALSLSSGSSSPSYAITPILNTVGAITFWIRGGGASTLTILKSDNGGAFTTFTTQAITSSFASYTIVVNDINSNVRIQFQNGQGTTFYLDDVSTTALASSVVTVSATSLPSFGNVVTGSASASANSYWVKGTKVSADLKVKAPSGFQVSTDDVSFGDSIFIPKSGDSVATTQVYVRFAPSSAVGSTSGSVANSTDSAITQNVNVSGVALSTEPTQSCTLGFGSVTGNSIALTMRSGGGSRRIVVARSGSPVSYVPTDAAAEAGVSSNFSSATDKGNSNKVVYDGVDSTTVVAGLSAGTTYYFAVYEYNVGTGNSQNYFTVSPATGNQTTLSVPTLSVTPASLSFGSVIVDSTSTQKTYSLSGNFLTPTAGNVTMTAPAGFDVSTSSAGGFASSMSVSYSSSTLNSTPIYVRFHPTSTTAYNAAIVQSGGGADSVRVAVTGKGVLQQPTQTYPTIVVAKDGSGDFTTIQAALDAIDTTHTGYIVVLVKNGVYDEHVSFRGGLSFVALVGESRDSTRIEHALARSDWYATYGVNTGCGVVNIAANDSCIVIGNMSIVNTYVATEDYTEVVRSETGGTKIWTVNCKIWCQYKDTFSLWGKNNGRYYAANCSFRGSIDAVCPRGWCYIIGSEFIETLSSSPIWHEGWATGQKFVIQNGSVRSETNKSVKLENSQSNAMFFYLDCLLSDSIGSQGVSSPTYYWNCHRSGTTGDASWFATNTLSSASGSPSHTDVNAAWTFAGAWDPENEMPAVLPFASLPQPFDKAYDVAQSLSGLQWIGGRNAQTYNVYFGTNATPPLVANQVGTVYAPSSLQSGTTYYWRVDAVADAGTVQGNVWQFKTAGPTQVAVTDMKAPTRFALKQNYPNPFNPSTQISFTVRDAGHATLKVYDLLGRQVAQLFDGQAESGKEYTVRFDASSTSSGVYFCILRSGTQQSVKKMLLAR